MAIPACLQAIPALSDLPTPDGSLIIEADNLPALRALLPDLANSIDVAIMDPPYGGDRTDTRYLDQSHDWLTRISLTFQALLPLLSPTGVVFVHIDDDQLFSLGQLLDSMFMPQNRLGIITWRTSHDNNPSRISKESEYILAYAKDRSRLPSSWHGPLSRSKQLLLAYAAELRATVLDPQERQALWLAYLKQNKSLLRSYATHYRFLDETGRPYRLQSTHWPGGGGPTYAVLHPLTHRPVRLPAAGWRYQEATMLSLISQGLIVFGQDETKIPDFKRYLDFDLQGKLPDIILDFPGQGGHAAIKRLFPQSPRLFKYPKSVALTEYLLSFVASPQALVLDPYAGICRLRPTAT